MTRSLSLNKAGLKNDNHLLFKERRRMYRIRVLLRIHCHSIEIEKPFQIHTENISTGGMKFISRTRLNSGDIVIMRMKLHRPFPDITLDGRVVWCRELELQGEPPIDKCYEGGIEFIVRDCREIKYLEKFIDKFWICEFETRYYGFWSVP